MRRRVIVTEGAHHVVPGVVVPNTAGEVLMVHTHNRGRDSLVLPGGVVDHGEAPTGAAEREITEELGLHLQVTRLLVVQHKPAPKVGLAHLPLGSFAANAAWLTCAAMCHNLLRAAGSLASIFHAKARGATLRRHLINIPARLARTGRDHITLHLPDHWPWQSPSTGLFKATHGPPAPA